MSERERYRWALSGERAGVADYEIDLLVNLVLGERVEVDLRICILLNLNKFWRVQDKYTFYGVQTCSSLLSNQLILKVHNDGQESITSTKKFQFIKALSAFNIKK